MYQDQERTEYLLKDLLENNDQSEWQKVRQEIVENRTIINFQGVRIEDLNDKVLSYLFYLPQQNNWEFDRYSQVFNFESLDDEDDKLANLMEEIINNVTKVNGIDIDNKVIKIIKAILYFCLKHKSYLIGGIVSFFICLIPFLFYEQNRKESQCQIDQEKLIQGSCYRDFTKSPLRIGVIEADTKNFEKLKAHLQEKLPETLKKGVIIERLAYEDQNYREQFNQKLENYEWDIVFAYSPIPSITAKNNGYKWIARMFADFPAHYQTALFVRSDSSIKSIDDFDENHTIILGPKAGSASGFYYPVYLLYGKTLKVKDDPGDSDKRKQMVANREVDIASALPYEIQDKNGNYLPEYRVIALSNKIPGGGVYLSPNISPNDQKLLTKVIQEADDNNPNDNLNEIKDRKIGANYGDGKEYDWDNEPFMDVINRVDEIIDCVDFEQETINFFCSQSQQKGNKSQGLIRGFTIYDDNKIRFNFHPNNTSKNYYIIIDKEELTKIKGINSPLDLEDKEIELVNLEADDSQTIDTGAIYINNSQQIKIIN